MENVINPLDLILGAVIFCCLALLLYDGIKAACRPDPPSKDPEDRPKPE
jgi:hypothetical protein